MEDLAVEGPPGVCFCGMERIESRYADNSVDVVQMSW